MNRFFSSSASYLALLAAGSVLSVPFAARADSFTVVTGTTQTGQQTVSGTDTGQIDTGGTLDVTGSAIIWNGAATGPAGISIVNDGTIISGSRAIDTSGAVSGPFTLQNDGSIESTNDTLRINNAFNNGNLHVVNTGSMISNTGQVFDLNGATSATATVLIENTGDITALENDAIRFGAGTITLINSGTIEALDGNRALSFDDDGNVETLTSFELVNQLGGKILGTDDAFKISGDSDDTSAVISIGNYGLIDGGEGQALDFADLTSPDNVITVTNYAGGIIQSQSADAMRPGAGATVTNYGLIQSVDLTSDGDGVDFQGAGGTVVNKTGGQILGAKHGITGDGAIDVTNEAGGLIVGRNGSGINVDSTGDTVVTVTNHGTIRGAVTGLLDDDGDPAVPDGDGDGVDVDGKVALDNYGLIQGTGATGTKDGDLNTADGIAAGGGVIHNHAGGVIEAYDNYFNEGVDNVGRAILIDDSAQGPAPFSTALTNEGVIRSDGVAVTFIGANDDIIDNAGTIQTGDANDKAVDMGDGDDRFVYRSGSQMVGYVTGSTGNDTFELGGSGGFDLGLLGNDAQYRDFEALLVGAGSSFTATGASSFAGAVTLNGSLVLNGSLASANVSVGSGAMLGGNATLGGLTVGTGGIVSPGNSVGTITVDGTATFEAGSTYAVEISGNSSDQIIAGTSAINGGTVELSALGSLSFGTYTIVSASQTTTPDGQFDTLVAPDFLFTDATLGRDGASITLELVSNGVSFASFAQTANQAAVADALSAAGGGALYSTLAAATAGEEADVAAGFDLLSGEAHASLGNTLFNQSALVADTLVGRLRQASAGTSPATAALAFDGPVLAYGPTSPASPFPMNATAAGATGPIYSAWAQGFGQWNSADGNGDAAKLDSSLGGFLAGADVTMGYATFGIAAGYASASSNVDARLSSADASTVLIAAYAGASFDDFRLRGGVSHGWSDIDTKRTAGMLGLAERPTASYDGSTTNLFVEAAYAAEAGGMGFEPFAQLDWSRIETDSFSETNAPATGLSSSGLSFDVPYSTLGLRLAKSFAVGAGTLTPHATLAWRHAYGDVTPELAMSFVDTGGSFSIAGTPIARNSFVLSAGFDFNVSQNLSLNVDYEGQLASETNTNAVKGGLTYRF